MVALAARAAGLEEELALAREELALARENRSNDACEVESRVEVRKMSARIEALEKRVRNARLVSDKSERLAAEAVVEQLAAKREARVSSEHCRRLTRYVEAARRREARSRLREARYEREAAIKAAAAGVRGLESDPEITLPIGVVKRRSLAKLESRLSSLRREAAEADAVERELREIDELDEKVRSSVVRGDANDLRRWIGHGARVDAPDADGATALDYACQGGRADLVKACLDAGADPIGGSLGIGALGIVRRGKGQALALAASRPLVLASDRGHLAVVETLLDAVGPGEPTTLILASGDACGRTPLHAAAARGRPRVSRALLRAGAVVDALDDHGATPLHLAFANENDTPDDVIRLLLDHGADAHRRNVIGETPADIARRVGRAPLVAAYERDLVAHRRAISSKNDDLHLSGGRRALHQDADDSLSLTSYPRSLNALDHLSVPPSSPTSLAAPVIDDDEETT
ncbi:hypothetical protein CTAYLR_000819 [Chrysophaeum taylorii]|uniref:Uncharacterized protein n=1 Tax=Chrysophaeum taylorii TaxID=2483200 RepID=A0AAD7XNT4_9STRA|nr:hypothetical protein CTAYLR_000819 [Chrysophaeum taylorii]